jgi:predicted FMN-binding regulatory protein PaiB
MNSTPDLKAAEADNVLVARADERLAHAYEKIARADEQLARVTEQLSKMEEDAARRPPAVARRRPSHGGAALRGVVGLLLAACIVVVAFASQSSYGDAAKLIITHWAPHLISTLSLSSEKAVPPAQPGPVTVQVAAAETAPQQATPSSGATTQEVAPPVAPTAAEMAQLLQAMTRALANVEQGVQELRAGQERMASDNAQIVEQLRASQEQMARLIARTPEPNLGPKTSLSQTSVPQASTPRPVAAPTRKPIPPHPQARAQPQSPVLLGPPNEQ